jgi:large subunit ribosomal protein L18
MSVRRRLRRSGPKVRLAVFRSLKHIFAQVIDDRTGHTLCAVGTSRRSDRDALAGKNKSQRAAWVGQEIARLARERGVEAVVFDRGPFKFHGRLKALAEAARAGGLKF